MFDGQIAHKASSKGVHPYPLTASGDGPGPLVPPCDAPKMLSPGRSLQRFPGVARGGLSELLMARKRSPSPAPEDGMVGGGVPVLIPPEDPGKRCLGRLPAAP